MVSCLRLVAVLLQFYRVILLVPDIVDRSLIKEFVNILLLRMEFAAAFVHQVSPCSLCALTRGLVSSVWTAADSVWMVCR